MKLFTWRRIAIAAGAAVSGFAFESAAIAAGEDYLGQWRVIRGAAAPWAQNAGAPAAEPMLGARIRFRPNAVRAPAPLGCENAVYTPTRMSPDGLFQGGLTEPAADAAALGFSVMENPGEISGISLSCDSGLFEFHAADGETMLFALDNVIWTMSRSPGALAPASTPEGVVEAFLEAHFAGAMHFTEERGADYENRFTSSLRKKIAAYFAASRPADEPPPINGDPFTDSQEQPVRFAVGRARLAGAKAVAPVSFADAYGSKTVEYFLARRNERWRIDDIRYGDGTLLSALLAE